MEGNFRIIGPQEIASLEEQGLACEIFWILRLNLNREEDIVRDLIHKIKVGWLKWSVASLYVIGIYQWKWKAKLNKKAIRDESGVMNMRMLRQIKERQS